MKRRETKVKFAKILSSLEARGHFRSRQDLASRLGVSQSSVSQYFTGRARPTFEKLVALADELSVSVDYLLTGRETEKGHVEISGAIRYIDLALIRQQQKTDAQTRLVGRFVDVLRSELLEESKRVTASHEQYQGGIITEGEALALETYSNSSAILLMNPDYDIADGQRTGLFFEVVAENVRDSREYRFLLPAKMRDWTDFVDTYRSHLIERCGTEKVARCCQFRQTSNAILAGVGFYTLDTKALKREEPVKYERFASWIIGDRLGFVIAASRELQADSLMEPEHLSHAASAFEQMWIEAERI